MVRTLVLALVLAGGLVAADAPAPKPYPLDTCLVTGEKLDSMGGAATLVHEGQEYKFCCKGCFKDFKKDPAKYARMLSEKAAAKAATGAPAK